jgi:hypothetical protein
LGPLAKKKKILSGDAVLSFGVATGTDHRRNRTPFVAGVTALLLFLAHIVKAAYYVVEVIAATAMFKHSKTLH